MGVLQQVETKVEDLADAVIESQISAESLLKRNEATEATQAKRLAALRGKKMLFLAGDFMYPSMHSSLVDHLKMLQSHGLVIYGVFQEGKEDGKYYKAAMEQKCIDSAVFADVGAEDGHVSICRAVKEADLEIDGVWSPHEATQPCMSKVQELLGCPGNDAQAYENARDKYATRQKLKEANLNTIKAIQIWSADDSEKAATEVGFPMIIKPTVGMGSSGVYKATNQDELNELLKKLFNDIDSNWALNRNKIGGQAPVLAETYVIPTIFGGRTSEFDVEILLWDGELVYGNVIDNFEPQPPYFQEQGSLSPSLTPKNIQEELIQYCAASAKALGFTRGGFHVEAWYTPSGPILIEVNARIGGGRTAQTHLEVFGVDPMLEFSLAMMDIPINPPRSLTPKCAYGLMLVNAQVTGELSENRSYLDEAKECPLVTDVVYCAEPKQQVKGCDTTVPDWLGEIGFKGPAENLECMVKLMDSVCDNATKQSANQTTAP